MTENRLGGIIAAVPTPIDDNGAPDSERFRTHAKWALENGCDALNLLGSTGEANSFSVSRRKRIMSTASVGLDSRRFMVGTGMCDLATTVELTRFAFQMRYAAALVLPPFYYKNIRQEALLEWYAGLAEATKDTPIPLYIYNFPQMTGLSMEVETVRELHGQLPDRIMGMKDSSGDFDYAAEMAQIDGFDVFPGNEIGLAGPSRDRFAGCISATVNITAPAVAGMLAEPDDAERQAEVVRMREAIAAKPLVPAVKYLVARTHLDPEFERVLPPHLPLTDEQKAELDGIMSSV